jgi:hypothetical protein
MKYLFVLLSLLLISCDTNEKNDYWLNKYNECVKSPLEGKHEIRKLFEYTEKGTSHNSGGFFLLFGNFSSSTNSDKQYIKFAWKQWNNTYIISKIDLNKIRIKFEKCKQPYVIFILDEYEASWIIKGYNTHNIFVDENERFNIHVKNVIIVCNEDDWKFQIKMPME